MYHIFIRIQNSRRASAHTARPREPRSRSRTHKTGPVKLQNTITNQHSPRAAFGFALHCACLVCLTAYPELPLEAVHCHPEPRPIAPDLTSQFAPRRRPSFWVSGSGCSCGADLDREPPRNAPSLLPPGPWHGARRGVGQPMVGTERQMHHQPRRPSPSSLRWPPVHVGARGYGTPALFAPSAGHPHRGVLTRSRRSRAGTWPHVARRHAPPARR